MDNVTHSLLGAALAQMALPLEAPRPVRRVFTIVGVVAANLPDVDVALTGLIAEPLGNLLHHRGHTHTVLGAMTGSALILGACVLALSLRKHQLSWRESIWLAVLALVAPLLHIAMDGLNTYGVHPWWPIDDRWFYGDSVFIVEPLYWAAAAPLAFLFRSLVARGQLRGRGDYGSRA